MELPEHVSMLEAELRRRKEKNARYSLRAFSSFLEIHPSALSRILNGKLELSVAAALQIIPKLNLTPEEKERFIVSVAKEKYKQTLTTMFDAADLPEFQSISKALRESEEHLDGIANIVPDILWRSAADGSTTWYNKRWLDYTGQTLEQAVGWGWVDAIHPEDREKSAENYRQAVLGKRRLEQEHRIRSANGEYRWFLVRTEPVLNDQGEVSHMYGAATDIHDLYCAYEALRRKLDDEDPDSDSTHVN